MKDRMFALLLFVYFNAAIVVGIATYTPAPPNCDNRTSVLMHGVQCPDDAGGAFFRGAAWPAYLIWRAWWEVLK